MTGQVSVVSVFVRVRPMTPPERDHGDAELPGMRLRSNDPQDQDATVYDQSGTTIGGFTGILGQEALNRDVFERCFAPQLQTVLRGGNASLFCYGYTGSGKTHTVIGYGEERGLYFLAAERLLQELREFAAGGGGDGSLFLRATACEMYNDEVFDLMGADKLPCTLRVDESGQLQVLGPQSSVALDESESGVLKDLAPTDFKPAHATLVTRHVGLRSASVFRPEDVQEISRTCVQQRAVGSSTEHTQSSRSHALLRMEVVNGAILKAQAALDEAKAMVPPRKNAVDNVRTSRFTSLYDGSRRVLHPTGSGTGPMSMVTSPEGCYFVKEPPAGPKQYQLEGHEGEEAKTPDEWAAHFGLPKLVIGYMISRREFEEPGRWEAVQQALDEKEPELVRLLDDALAQVDQASQELEAVKSRGPAPLGGSLLLVDLAGADYDHRSGSQQKESATINKSLLSLKECFRSLAKASSAKPKFRDSKLTRLLEDSLAPAETTSRRNRESVSVMLVNVSPAEHLGKMTLNTLRYGQLFAAGDGGVRTGGRPAAAKAPPKRVVSPAFAAGDRPSTRAQPRDPTIREELLAIYREHCPAKTEQDVQVIIDRFAGREAELLQKARDKYIGGA